MTIGNLFALQHSSSVNEQLKGCKCKYEEWEWELSETDGAREGAEEKKGKKENHHGCDEWRLWHKPSGDRSVTETGFCGPNFIIMTQSHQHTASDQSLHKESVKPVWVQWLVANREDLVLFRLWRPVSNSCSFSENSDTKHVEFIICSTAHEW